MVALTVVDARPPAMAAGIPLLAADRTVADHRMAVDHPTVAARLTAVDLWRWQTRSVKSSIALDLFRRNAP